MATITNTSLGFLGWYQNGRHVSPTLQNIYTHKNLYTPKFNIYSKENRNICAKNCEGIVQDVSANGHILIDVSGTFSGFVQSTWGRNDGGNQSHVLLYNNWISASALNVGGSINRTQEVIGQQTSINVTKDKILDKNGKLVTGTLKANETYYTKDKHGNLVPIKLTQDQVNKLNSGGSTTTSSSSGGGSGQSAADAAREEARRKAEEERRRKDEEARQQLAKAQELIDEQVERNKEIKEAHGEQWDSHEAAYPNYPNTWEYLLMIAKQMKLGFAATQYCEYLGDNAKRLVENKSFLDYMKSEIKYAGTDENNVLDAWIDINNYIVLVNLSWVIDFQKNGVDPKNLGVFATIGDDGLNTNSVKSHFSEVPRIITNFTLTNTVSNLTFTSSNFTSDSNNDLTYVGTNKSIAGFTPVDLSVNKPQEAPQTQQPAQSNNQSNINNNSSTSALQKWAAEFMNNNVDLFNQVLNKQNVDKSSLNIAFKGLKQSNPELFKQLFEMSQVVNESNKSAVSLMDMVENIKKLSSMVNEIATKAAGVVSNVAEAMQNITPVNSFVPTDVQCNPDNLQGIDGKDYSSVTTETHINTNPFYDKIAQQQIREMFLASKNIKRYSIVLDKPNLGLQRGTLLSISYWVDNDIEKRNEINVLKLMAGLYDPVKDSDNNVEPEQKDGEEGEPTEYDFSAAYTSSKTSSPIDEIPQLKMFYSNKITNNANAPIPSIQYTGLYYITGMKFEYERDANSDSTGIKQTLYLIKPNSVNDGISNFHVMIDGKQQDITYFLGDVPKPTSNTTPVSSRGTQGVQGTQGSREDLGDPFNINVKSRTDETDKKIIDDMKKAMAAFDEKNMARIEGSENMTLDQVIDATFERSDKYDSYISDMSFAQARIDTREAERRRKEAEKAAKKAEEEAKRKAAEEAKKNNNNNQSSQPANSQNNQNVTQITGRTENGGRSNSSNNNNSNNRRR